MAYNTKKGSQHSGDIQYEGDPNDTQIDFENDSIGLKTGGTTRVLVTDTGLSGSAGLQTVGATILGSTLNVSGNTTVIGTVSASTDMFTGRNFRSAFGRFQVNSAGDVTTTGTISGSGILQVAAAITSSGDIVGSGSVHATNFYGDGSTLTGVGAMDSIGLRGTDGSTQTITNGNTIFIEAGSGISTTAATGDKVTIAASGTVAQLTTGVETSGYLKVSGSSTLNAITATGISGSGTLQTVGATTLGSTLNVSGGTIIGTGNGAHSLTVNAGGWDAGGQYAISGSGRIRGYSMHAGNNQIHLGNDEAAAYWPAGEAYILNQGHYSGSKSLTVGGPISGSGTLFMSGTISGAAELQAVGATTLGSTLNVSGVVTAPSITGSMGLYSLANGTLQVGHEEVGTGVAVKISTTSDNSVPMLVKTPSHETLFAVTGSGKVVIGGMHFDAKLNVSGSDPDKLISAAAASRGETFYISGSGEAFISGSVILQDTEPTIYFSGSDGSTILGQIGYNSSDNILIQNNSSNKHIVFKASDNGTIKEGLRLDGAVPEVVVNQQGPSSPGGSTLVDFRVESNNNTHMFFVSGSTDQVGVGVSDPAMGVSLDISGSAIRLRDSSTPANAGAAGVPGEIRWDADYIYVCIGIDSWKRVAIAAW